MNTSSSNQLHIAVEGLLFSRWNFNVVTLNGGVEYRSARKKSATFVQHLAISQK